ncbi:MAG: hypothetical protein FJ405_10165 [Verrucomicrobia bacterium]|nr:hypothetical protein [Verrucomicrobiota bacterium]
MRRTNIGHRIRPPWAAGTLSLGGKSVIQRHFLSLARFLLILVTPTLFAADSPGQSEFKPAPSARIDLYGQLQTGSLSQPTPLAGTPSFTRPTWMKSRDQSRAWTATLPLSTNTPTQAAFSLIAERSGSITISLLGPVPPNAENRLVSSPGGDVVWESLELEGAEWIAESRALLRLPIRSSFRQRYDLVLRADARKPFTLKFTARPAQGYQPAPSPTPPLDTQQNPSPAAPPGSAVPVDPPGAMVPTLTHQRHSETSPARSTFARVVVVAMLGGAMGFFGLLLFLPPRFTLQSSSVQVFQPNQPPRASAKQDTATLAREMRERVVARLLQSRQESDSLQQQAAQDLAELERRLELLKTPLQERLRAYESRIGGLEAQLGRMGEQNKKLILAKIEATRQKLLESSAVKSEELN